MAVSGLFSYVFYRSMAAFELMLPVSGVFLVLRERRQRLKKRKLLLAQQFKEAMVILAASLSAGYAMGECYGGEHGGTEAALRG